MSIFIKAGLWTSKKTGYKGELNLTQLFSGGGNNSYSQTEALTGGTWIDGKPIYRKVISFTAPDYSGFATSSVITHNLNIDKYLKADGLPDVPVENVSQDCSWFFPIFGSNTANLALEISGFVTLNTNNITFESVRSAITSTNDFLLILEYTKI
jgi:hypothetical protein